jgi:Interleukin-like EMT inducer
VNRADRASEIPAASGRIEPEPAGRAASHPRPPLLSRRASPGPRPAAPRTDAGPPDRLGWRGLGLLYAGFAAGVAAVTWPLVLSPGSVWPAHHDPRFFTWVMATMARRLLADPSALFHGNALYPYGETLAFSEPLLVPSLLGLAGFVWGNPVLTYNLLLLALWPLNGVAMAWTAHRLTGSRAGAWLAGAVFCLSPYFTEYHVEFQMLLAAPLPVVLYAWVRWLETQRGCWLAGALAGLTLQGLTTWYYTIILGLALVALALGFLCLRWRDWAGPRMLGALALGGAGVGLVLGPVAWPYVVTRRELGYERHLDDSAAHSADVLTFLEPGGRSLLYGLDPAGHVTETSTFVGFTVLALAVVAATVWLRRGRSLPPPVSWMARALRTLLIPVLAVAVALCGWPMARHQVGRLVVHLRAAGLLDLGILLGVALLLCHGCAASRARAPRRLGEADWVRLLVLLAGCFTILAVGPVIHFGGQETGPGPYLTLYHLLLPLHAIRITTRFAVIVVAACGLLAALGVRALEDGLAAHPGRRRLVLAAAFSALGLEYAVAPVPYEAVAARPVDAVLRAEPAPAAVLEVPTNVDDSDGDAMFRSLAHGKYVVNGISGFVPDSLAVLSRLLSTPERPFPTHDVQAALRRIYPLRYLVVRTGDDALSGEQGSMWTAVRESPPPLLRFRGTFGADDLYEVAPLPERGLRIERAVSYDFLRRHPVLRATLRPLVEDPELEQLVEVGLNGRLVQRLSLEREVTVALTLAPPYRLAAPQVVTLQYRYRRPGASGDARYRIGTTGVTSPGDLRVLSVGQPHGSACAIELDGVNLAPDLRGYNLVALDAATGLHRAAAFDTYGRPRSAARLAAWVAGLPAGTIVAGAVRDEGSGHLTDEGVQALRTLGVAGDLRGRFRDAHAFVGVKGARPGSAVEVLGSHPVEVRVGWRPPAAGELEAGVGLELEEFALEAPAAGRR